MEPEEIEFVAGRRCNPPVHYAAEIGLYSSLPGQIVPTHHCRKFSNLVEGMAAVSPSSMWAYGMVFTIRDTGFVHVVADHHDDDEEDAILCYCRPQDLVPFRQRVAITVLGFMAPLPRGCHEL